MVKSKLQNQRGQATVEGVLLIALFIGIVFLVSREFRSNDLIPNVVSGPWRSLNGMIQHGSWNTPDQARGRHPLIRRTSYDSEVAGPQ